MSSIKQFRLRINAIKSAEKITSTMNMVASAKFVQARYLFNKANCIKNYLSDSISKHSPDLINSHNVENSDKAQYM